MMRDCLGAIKLVCASITNSGNFDLMTALVHSSPIALRRVFCDVVKP